MIRRIENKPMQLHRWHNDIVRLQAVMLQNGFEADYEDAITIWEDYSDNCAAGWLNLPDDDYELWQIIKDRVEYDAL